MKDIKMFLIKLKVRIDIGVGLLNYFKYLFYGLGIRFILSDQITNSILTGFAYFMISFVLGLLYVRFKFMELEQQYYPEKLNPYFIRLEEKINHILNGKLDRKK